MSVNAADVVDDEDPRLVYTPPGNWMLNYHYGNYNVTNGTIHYAIAGLSTVSLNFTSDYIGANFLLLQTGANFSVYLDGQLSGPYNTAVTLGSEVGPALLFEKAGLDPNVEHNIQVEMITPGGWKSPILGVSAASVNFDSFSLVKGATIVASGTRTGSGNSNTSTILPPTGPAPKSATNISTPVIVGAALGGLTGWILFLVFVIIYLRRRKRYYEKLEPEKDGSLHSTAVGRGFPSYSTNRYFPLKLISESSKPKQIVPFPNEMGNRTRLHADIDNGLTNESTRSNHRAGKIKRDVGLRNSDDDRDVIFDDDENSIYSGVVDEYSIAVNQVESSGQSTISPNANGRGSGTVSPYMREKQRHNYQNQNQHRPSPSMDSTPTHPDGLPPSHPSSSVPIASNTSLPLNDAVLRELMDLRAEVRRLTHIQATRNEGSSVITSATPAVPPPLYGQ